MDTIEMLAAGVEAWEVGSGLNSGALCAVSTYYAASPDPQLSPRARAFLAKFPPYSTAEIESGQCESAVCNLARYHGKAQR